MADLAAPVPDTAAVRVAPWRALHALRCAPPFPLPRRPEALAVATAAGAGT
jgi:hypothetical protein